MPKTGSDASFALALRVAAIASLLLASALAVGAPFAYVTSLTTPSAVSVIDTANNNIVAIVPSSGRGPIAANAAGTRLYVAAYEGLSIIDTATNAVVGRVPFDAYGAIFGVAVNTQGTRAYVAVGEGGMGGDYSVSVIDLTTNTVLATLPFGDFAPVGIALNPAGSRMYVPATGWFAPGGATDEVWVIDAATYAVAARIAVPAGVEKVALNAAGTRVYIAGWVEKDHSGSLSIIDTATNAIVATLLLVGVPTDVAVKPDGTRIYVSTYPDSLYIIDAATLAVVATVPVGTFAGAIATNPDGTRVYVASSNGISVVDSAMNTVVATIPITAPMDIVVSPAAAGSATLVEAVEYYHSQFDHYFLTADPAEILALDSGAIPGWSRTGERYRVYIDAGAGRAPVCRFYTAAFAGKASHFYTASPGECAYVKQLQEWTFEGVVFYVPLPDESGTCGAGSAPVYRLYNDGSGGAPNHAYTADIARRDRLMAAGWIAEGTAWCAPLD